MSLKRKASEQSLPDDTAQSQSSVFPNFVSNNDLPKNLESADLLPKVEIDADHSLANECMSLAETEPLPEQNSELSGVPSNDDGKGSPENNTSSFHHSHDAEEFRTSHFYNILSSYTQHVKQMKTDGKTVCFEFRNLEAAKYPHNVVINVFQEIIDQALEAGNGNRFGVAIDAPDMNKSFLIPFRPVEQNNPASIAHEFDRLIQSNENLSLTDSKWSVKVTTFQLLEGTCRTDKDKTLRQSAIIQIVNPRDNLCLTRALAVGIAFFTNRKCFGKIKSPRSRLQLLKARQLLSGANLDSGKASFDLEDVHQLQLYLDSVFPEKFRIVVFSKEMMNRIVYKGQSNAQHDVCLYLINNHFHFLKSPSSLFKRRFCIECEKAYSDKVTHARNCKLLCIRCRNFNGNCKDPIFPPLKCVECNIAFLSQSCYNEHKRAINKHNGKPKKSICSLYRRCEQCGKLLVLMNMKNQRHICGDNYCRKCHVYHPQRNHCYIPRLKLEQIPVYRTVWFDLETTQHDQVAAGVFEHKVNFAVAQAMCTKCIDADVEFNPSAESTCHFCGPKYQLVSSALEQKNPIEELMQFIFNGPRNCVTKVFSHYGGKFDMHFVLKYLHTSNYPAPEICVRGQKIYKLRVTTQNRKIVEFIDSYNFLNTALANLPPIFNLETPAKLYFPHYFNRPDNYHLHLQHLPPLEFYGVNHMMSEQKQKFLQWYNANKDITPFSLENDLYVYTMTDVKLLREACIRFRRLYLDISNIDPYVKSCTIAGVCMNIYRTLFLPRETIGIMPENGYNREQRQSVLALKYLAYESLKTGTKIQHRNSSQGEYKIPLPQGGHIRVDGYFAGGNLVYEILGCYYHGCRYCFPCNRDKQSAHGRTIEENFQIWLERLLFLQSQDYNVKYVWECEINRMLKNDQEMKRFFNEAEIVDPISIRQDGYFGGRTQPSRLYYKVRDGEEIKGFDIVSLYPSQMRDKPLPIGHPRVLREEDIKTTLPWKRPEDCSYKGIIKCRVLPPQNLIEPVLPYRTTSGRLLFPLCAKCGEIAQLYDEVLQDLLCQHTDSQRSWVHAFCHPELEEALAKGYQVSKIYEVWEYEKFSTTLFTDYVNKFIKIKVESSGFPKGVTSENDKMHYIETFEREQGITLERDKIISNPGLRHIAKLSLNSLYGKFGQANNMSEVVYATNYGELVKYFCDHTYLIQDLVPVNENGLVRVTRCKKEDFVVESDISNVALCSFITCYSRLRLYHFLDIVKGRVLYVDTDSCYYISKPGHPDIPESSLLGGMSQEYTEFFIDEIIAPGAKQYCLHMTHRETGEPKTVLKIRGFTLDCAAEKMLCYQTLKESVFKHYGHTEENTKITLTFPQIKRTKRNEIQTAVLNKTYTPVYRKGLVLPNFETRPFGFRVN